ncbi:MAG: thiamine-monophosphate kinase [Candidatus Azotimanducaceae bacterium]|jgi:thiamine-monophosphate kinase
MDEFDIIRRYFLNALMPEYVNTGPGDDCAVLTIPVDHSLCVSTDTLIAGVHFPNSANPAVVANRAFGANLSDLAAMGAKPYGVTLALTLPSGDEHWLDRFSAACQAQADAHQCPIVGGNLAKGDLSITLTVMGTVPNGSAILRSGASRGDDIYVSGFLGDAAGAVQQLGSIDANAELLKTYEAPAPRLALGIALRGIASAAIDISDGFLADLGHLVVSSGVGAVVDLDHLPLSLSLVETFDKPAAIDFALRGGDDYELCFSAHPDHRLALAKLAEVQGLRLSRLGEIVSGESIVVDKASGCELSTLGYRHFS